MARFGWQGTMLIAGGVFTVLANGLTPLLNPSVSFAERSASGVFLWRQGLSALAALSLLVGTVGLIRQFGRQAGRGSLVGVALAILGSALLFAHEWSQVAVVYPLAQVAPTALTTLEEVPGPNAFDTSALLAITTFSLGWLAMAVILIRTRLVPRHYPFTLIAGFFAVPLLSAVVGPVAGTVIGSAILGAGWILIGYEIRTRADV